MADEHHATELRVLRPLFEAQSSGEEIECGICYCPVIDAVRCTNRHLFCRNCVIMWKASTANSGPRVSARPLTDGQREYLDAPTAPASFRVKTVAGTTLTENYRYWHEPVEDRRVGKIVENETGRGQTSSPDRLSTLTSENVGSLWVNYDVSKLTEQIDDVVDGIKEVLAEADGWQWNTTAAVHHVDTSGSTSTATATGVGNAFADLTQMFNSLTRLTISGCNARWAVEDLRRVAWDISTRLDDLVQTDAKDLMSSEITGSHYVTSEYEDDESKTVDNDVVFSVAVRAAVAKIVEPAAKAIAEANKVYAAAHNTINQFDAVNNSVAQWIGRFLPSLEVVGVSLDEKTATEVRRLMQPAQSVFDGCRATIVPGMLNVKQWLRATEKAMLESTIDMWRQRAQRLSEESDPGGLYTGCPVCRQWGRFESSPDVDEVVAELSAACPFVDVTTGSRCRWTGRNADYGRHVHEVAQSQTTAAAETSSDRDNGGQKRRHEDDDDDDEEQSEQKKVDHVVV